MAGNAETKTNEKNADAGHKMKVIVAVHGIGDQIEFATIQQTAAQFCLYHKSTFAVPLGNFHNGLATFALPDPVDPKHLRELLFAEVYWAGIPREVVKDGYKLEDAQAWAKTIVGRVRQRAEESGQKYGEHEYSLLEEVLREIRETLGVLGRVFYLSAKMGLFSFDLDKIIKDYLDDVQLVAEFKEESICVVRRFSQKMDDIYREMSQNGVTPEIYLVSHSEGTVITLLGLLSAICGQDAVYGVTRPPWLDCVRGWMTIGSPIDKHLVLWPELFTALKKPLHQPVKPLQIEWRNYYDLGDPVGFELPMARQIFNGDGQQAKSPWHWFNFPVAHDHGFTRSLFPGKAHTDYWNDPAVFGHFIQSVVYKDSLTPPRRDDKVYDQPPGDRPWHKIGSWILPYVAALALLFFAVYTLYKAVKNCLSDNDLKALETTKEIFLNVGGITSLFAGLTVTARIPRLTREWPWRVVGILIFLVGAFGYWKLTLGEERNELGHLFTFLHLCPTWGLLGLATLIAVFVNIIARRYPQAGVKPLLWFGGLSVLAIIVDHIFFPIPADNTRGAIWPVVLAGAFFLYLWWLTILFFDLVFVWHRYIQASVAQDRLNAMYAATRE